MFVEKRGSFYVVSRVTGPAHNELRVRFAEPNAGDAPPTVEALPPRGECRHGPLDAGRVLDAVVEGVEEANRCHGTGLRVAHVGYPSNDTPPEAAYGLLARELVRRVAREDFRQEDLGWR